MVQFKVVSSLVLLSLLLCMQLQGNLQVQAGDVNNPEVLDNEGDSVSGKTTRDVLWGYIGHEMNNTFAVVIGVSALETFTDPSQILTFPITEYEFYFTVKGVNYAAVATVPVHGPFGIDIRYELRTVEYNGSMPSAETQKTSIATADYSAIDGVINMTIDKSDVGGVEQGDIAENLWIATYSRQREGQFNMSAPALEDRAPDFGYGDNYIFRGSPGVEIVKLETACDSNRTITVRAFEQKKVEISVYNNGTGDVLVLMNNTTQAKFTISFSPSSMSLEPQTGQNITMTVKIKDPKKVVDKEMVAVQVWAETNIGNESAPKMKQSNWLTFTLTVSAPKPPPEKKTWFEQFRDDLSNSFKNNRNAWLGGIGGIAALVIVVVIVMKLRNRGGKKEDFEDLEVKVNPPPAPQEEEEDS